LHRQGRSEVGGVRPGVAALAAGAYARRRRIRGFARRTGMTECGIDIGYGRRRRSLGLAVRTTGPGRLGDVFPKRRPWLKSWVTSDGYVVEAVTLNIAELLDRVDGIHEGYPDLEIVVI